MKTMNLLKRGVGSIIDKLIIIIAFVVILFLFLGPYGFPKMLGTYVALMGFTPDSYPHLQQYSPYLIDFQITTVFVLLNIVYCFLSEYFFKTTLGKYMLGGVLVDKNQINIDTARIAKRCSILAIMMLAAIIVRWLFNTTYWTVIILFFLINELPVLLMNTHQSMIDFVSSTFLVMRNKSNPI